MSCRAGSWVTDKRLPELLIRWRRARAAYGMSLISLIRGDLDLAEAHKLSEELDKANTALIVWIDENLIWKETDSSKPGAPAP